MVQPRPRHNPHPHTRWTRMLAAPTGDWSVFQQIFADHWEAFQHTHSQYQTPLLTNGVSLFPTNQWC